MSSSDQQHHYSNRFLNWLWKKDDYIWIWVLYCMGFFSFRRCYTLSHFYDFSHSNQRLKPWKDSCATAWIVSNEQMKFCFSCKLMQHLWHFCFALNYNNKINSTSLYVQLASVFFLYKTLPFRLCSLSDSHNKFSMIFNEYKILYIKD